MSNPKKMDNKFQEGLGLFREGRSQEGADIWMDLAKLGHLDSIEQLTYIFLDQEDFEYVDTLLKCAENPNDPIILYLRARKIEESDGVEAALESFRIAVDAGSPHSCLRMFELSLEEQNTESARIYLTKLAKHSDYLESISPATTFEQLREELEEVVNKDCYNGTSGNVLKGLAGNSSCPEEILTKLAKDSDHEVRSAVAENPLTPAEILKTLAKDKSREVRESVARNTSTPIETLDVMAKVTFLRRTIAENPSISIALLRELSIDKNEYVRSSVAQNPITPSEILKILASDSADMVRNYVAKNVNTPPELLKELASDNNVGVRFSVALNLSAPLDLNLRIKLLTGLATLADEYGYGRGFLAQNPNTPIEILQLFSKDENHVTRCGVAVNPSTPVDILEFLGRPEIVDEYSYLVQARVAQNPSTPASLRKEIIEVLINDVSAWWRCHVAWNELAPSEVLRSLAKDKYTHVRSAVARNSATPVDVLSSLAEDENNSVKAALAENSKTPKDILRKFALIETL